MESESSATIFKTVRSYYQNTHKYSIETSILKVFKQDDLLGIVPAETIFHPQGGGQPSDTGCVRFKSTQYPIVNVAVQDFSIIHFICLSTIDSTSQSEIKPGVSIIIEINRKTRRKHAHLHSAGHIIDHIMNKTTQLFKIHFQPCKGNHFPESCYVEYKTTIPVEIRLQFQLKMQQFLDEFFSSPSLCFQSPEKTILKDYTEITKVLGHPAPLFAPGGKLQGHECRIVKFIDSSCPCGGTHVDLYAEIPGVTIDQVVKKKKNIRIYYSIAYQDLYVSFAPLPDLKFQLYVRRFAELESLGFPPDEAATPARVFERANQAPQYFYGCFGQGYSLTKHGKSLLADDSHQSVYSPANMIGFMMGTCISGDSLTEESMETHDPTGNLLCIHSVVIHPGFEGRGIGKLMVKRYVEYIRSLVSQQKYPVTGIALICKSHLCKFYSDCGFKMVGPSPVVHGQDPWFEFQIQLAD